jgi:hypothetical protein
LVTNVSLEKGEQIYPSKVESSSKMNKGHRKCEKIYSAVRG